MTPSKGRSGRGEDQKSPAENQIGRLYELTQQLHRQGRLREAMENAARTRDLAFQSLGEEHPLVAASLNQLAGLYHAIGDDTAALPLLEKGLTILRHTFGEGHDLVRINVGALAEVGVALFHRYERTGHLNDLSGTIAALRAATAGAPADFGDLGECLGLLGGALTVRYNMTGQLDDLKAANGALQAAVGRVLPDSPHWGRYLGAFGRGMGVLHEQTGRLADLEEAVQALSAVALHAPQGSSEGQLAIGHLGMCLGRRFQITGRSTDLEAGIKALQQAADGSPENSRERILFVGRLGASLLERYERTGQEADLREAIAHCRLAAEVTSADSANRPEYMTSLGRALLCGYQRSGLPQDLAAAIEALQAGADGAPPGSPTWSNGLSNLGVGLAERYARTGDLADLDAMVAAYQAAVDGVPREVPDRPHLLSLLGVGLSDRFERTSRLEDLEAALVALKAAVETAPAGHSRRPGYLNNLGKGLSDRYERMRRPEDLEASLGAFLQAVNAMPVGSPDRRRYLSNLGASLATRYERFGRPDDLDASIVAYQQAVDAAPIGSPDRPRYLGNLGGGLARRHRQSKRRDDLDAAVAAYAESCELGLAHAPSVALSSAWSWANWAASRQAWSEAARAGVVGLHAIQMLYETQLLPGAKETWLREAQGLPTLTAYVLARSGDDRAAVEALEHGRARLLIEALSRDRADVTRVQTLDPSAFAAYTQAAWQLRQLELRDRADRTAERSPGLLASGAFQEQARRARESLNDAIARIRQLPGFAMFLRPPSFAELTSVVLPSHALAYLVTTSFGTLILLVHRQAEQGEAAGPVVETIWAPALTSNDLENLIVQYDGETVVGGYLPGQLGSAVWLDAALAEALPRLGVALTGPMATRLRTLGVAVVYLVPTGLLSLLPLHAATYQMGGEERCLLDDVDVSFVPSARVLFASRSELKSREIHPPVLVGVANPLPHPQHLAFADPELEQVSGFFPGGTSHSLYGSAATKASVLELLRSATHIHFACHGRFDPSAPLDSCLELARCSPIAADEKQSELRLGELLGRDWFQMSRLVVLSACQTAITDFRRLPDEAIGLPAGLLQAGVPGVVGTLWAVDDFSTMLLMTKFYRYHRQGDCDTAPLAPAQALRRAQLWLRDVTAGVLAVHFAVLRDRAPDNRRYELASAGWRRFVALPPDTHPFSQRHWASFIFVGV